MLSTNALTLEVNRLRVKNGLSIEPERYPTLYSGYHLSQQSKLGLRTLAAQFGFMHGTEPNVTKLLEAIGQGLLTVDFSPELGGIE